MRHATTLAAASAVLLLLVPVLVAQRMTPTAPGSAGDPRWQGRLQTADGRTFVTDGGLAIDAVIAQPTTMPEREYPGKLLDDHLRSPHTDECGVADLRADASGKTYRSPNGLALNATYVDFLRRKVPAGTLRFRMSEELRPIVVLADGRAVGVLMPVKQ